jgi:hypothetical protein
MALGKVLRREGRFHEAGEGSARQSQDTLHQGNLFCNRERCVARKSRNSGVKALSA